MPRPRLERSLLVACLAACLALSACEGFEPGRRAARGPLAKGGVLDLRGWDFSADGPADLSGEWRFAPSALLDGEEAASWRHWRLRAVPDVWKRADPALPGGRGAATYELDILLPQRSPPLAIRNYAGTFGFELEVDGALLERAGLPSLDPGLARSAYAPGITPVERRGGEMRVIVRTSNYEYRAGGIWRPFAIGAAADLERRRAADYAAALSISVAILALGLNYLVIFLYRRKERLFLLFAAECLALSVRPLVTGENALAAALPFLSFDAMVRIEYASAMLGVPAVLAVFLSLFPGKLRPAGSRLLILPFLPFALGLLFLPLRLLTMSIFPFYAAALACLCVSLFAVLLPAASRREPGGRTMLAATLALVLAALNDLLYGFRLIQTASLFSPGLFLFVLLEAIVIAGRFTRAFDTAERLSRELEAANVALRAEIASGNATRAQLERTLAEKEILLREVHHRVKNSLQIVSSIVALKTMGSEDASLRRLAETIKNRIRVVSLVHERLYNVESGDRVDVGDYLKEIVGLNLEYAESGAPPVEARIEAEGLYVDGSFCIDSGLILTELIANAMRHAVLPSGGGGVRVRVAEEGASLVLEVEDEGPGFPEGFDPKAEGGLGFRVITSLLGRRKGRIEVGPGPGGRVRCLIPL